MAAALCIARRHQKFSEAPCFSEGMIPDGKGGHVALTLPARNRKRHVWHFWGKVKRKLSTVLAAHLRAMKNRSLSPPRSAHETGNPSDVIGVIPIREPSAQLLDWRSVPLLGNE